jgi:hypothetical protein
MPGIRQDLLNLVKNASGNVLRGVEEGLIPWINSKCGFDVKDIVMPYFEDLIVNTFPENVCRYVSYVEFYEKEMIDFVAARASSEKECIVPLAAAKEGARRVCFQHGSGAFHYKRYYVNEAMLFDYSFTMQEDARIYMEKVKTFFPETKHRTYSAPYQLNEIRKRWSCLKRDENLIMYVPTRLFLGLRFLNGYIYPITWYYEFQKSILDYFGSRPDKSFIFKYAPGQDWSRDAVLPYIKDKGYKNIAIETRPISECLGRVGKVFMDYPSTGFYEAAACGIPVMSLYHELLEVRPEAKIFFGCSLRSFRTTEDALAALKDFIESQGEKFCVDVPLGHSDPVDVLRSFVKDKRTKIV